MADAGGVQREVAQMPRSGVRQRISRSSTPSCRNGALTRLPTGSMRVGRTVLAADPHPGVVQVLEGVEREVVAGYRSGVQPLQLILLNAGNGAHALARPPVQLEVFSGRGRQRPVEDARAVSREEVHALVSLFDRPDERRGDLRPSSHQPLLKHLDVGLFGEVVRLG